MIKINFFHFKITSFFQTIVESSFFIEILMSENQPRLEEIGDSLNPDAKTAKWMLEKVF